MEQRGQEEQLTGELERCRVRLGEVNEELTHVLRELQNARMDSHENRRQQKLNEVLENLRRIYPDDVVLKYCLLKLFCTRMGINFIFL